MQTRIPHKKFTKLHKQNQQTPQWKSLKKQCLNYYAYMCAICGNHQDYTPKSKLILHHLNYKNYNEPSYSPTIGSDIIIVCKSCHFKIHKKIIILWKKHYYRYNPKYPPLNSYTTNTEKLRRQQLSTTTKKRLQYEFMGIDKLPEWFIGKKQIITKI